jgi:hypothetical protein
MCTDIVDQGRRSPEIRGRENLSSITDLFTGLSSGVMLIFKKKEKKKPTVFMSQSWYKLIPINSNI